MFFHPRPPWGIAASNRDGVSGCYVLGSCATRKSCSCRGSTSTCIWILGLGVGKWIGKSWKSVGPKVNGGASDRVWEKINHWKPAIYIWRKHSLDVMLKSPHNFTSAPLYEDPWIHVELLRKRKSYTSHLLTYMLRWGTADATGCCFWISCRKNGCNEVYIYILEANPCQKVLIHVLNRSWQDQSVYCMGPQSAVEGFPPLRQLVGLLTATYLHHHEACCNSNGGCS